MDATVDEARRLLPQLPADLSLRVDADDNVSGLTNSTAANAVPNRLYWTVDPIRGDGVVATAEAHLRSMLLHELHHLVRDASISRGSLMDHVVSEGMASAFERDVAGARYPFMDYPTDAPHWVAELLALPDHAPFSPDGQTQQRNWMFRHPDGRRWVGFRAGAYLADRASQASGTSAAALVTVPTEVVLRLAGIDQAASPTSPD